MPRESTSAQVKRPQVVIRNWLVWFYQNHLFEFFRRLFQIAALKQRYSEGEIVALESSLNRCAFQRQGFLQKTGSAAGNRPDVLQQTLRFDHSLVDLYNHAVPVQ